MHPNCERFRELPDPYLKLGVNPIENLNKIETSKVGERPEEDERSWRCRACCEPISMHVRNATGEE
jgi:hypothetical protein